jgi:hypothetical protein
MSVDFHGLAEEVVRLAEEVFQTAARAAEA